MSMEFTVGLEIVNVINVLLLLQAQTSMQQHQQFTFSCHCFVTRALISEMTAWIQQEQCMLECIHSGLLLWSHLNVHLSVCF